MMNRKTQAVIAAFFVLVIGSAIYISQFLQQWYSFEDSGHLVDMPVSVPSALGNSGTFDSAHKNFTSRASGPLPDSEKGQAGECAYFIKNYEVNLIWLQEDSVYEFGKEADREFLYADFIDNLKRRENIPHRMGISCKPDYPNVSLVKVLSAISALGIKYFLIPEEDFKACLEWR